MSAPPLFVLGVSRSGTTMLRVILDRSPGIAIPDETFFVPQLAHRHRGVVDSDELLEDVRRLPRLAAWGVPLEDIAARDDLGPAAVLGSPDIRGILAAPLGRSDKLKRVKARVRALRFPRLAALERSLDEEVRALELGPGVTVRFPPGLEGDEVTVEVRARRAEALREAVARLTRALEASAEERAADFIPMKGMMTPKKGLNKPKWGG